MFYFTNAFFWGKDAFAVASDKKKQNKQLKQLQHLLNIGKASLMQCHKLIGMFWQYHLKHKPKNDKLGLKHWISLGRECYINSAKAFKQIKNSAEWPKHRYLVSFVCNATATPRHRFELGGKYFRNEYRVSVPMGQQTIVHNMNMFYMYLNMMTSYKVTCCDVPKIWNQTWWMTYYLAWFCEWLTKLIEKHTKMAKRRW